MVRWPLKPMALFRKILIANRGEIAVRLIRACRDLEIPSVAVYSDADRRALHVQLADEAVHLGPAPARESYLSIARILDAARRTGADAIHPGYGFLAENPGFARACRDAGVTFIGPSPESMEALGSKTAARRLVRQFDVPVVPGTIDPLASALEARRVADQIGYPVMLKAAAGGGGKGMRLIASPEEVGSAFLLAQTEALNAFGDGTLFLEKAILRPRHIEIQILGDQHGNLVWLGERECSVQRRHQKIIEESPSPVLSEATRQAMGAAAVAAVAAAGYSNAGTVEFLLDDQQNFYFLEVNTRLQVEHPVTELVTGIDLVQEQIRIAAGLPLRFRQTDILHRGHAIECRVYAEDAANNFMPSPGVIQRLVRPLGPGLREDSGVYEGWTVPMDYDPMLSKLIAWGEDRAQAMARMRRALDEYQLIGIRHNLDFFRRVFADPDFQQGRFDTGYVARLQTQEAARLPEQWYRNAAIAAAIAEAAGMGQPALSNPTAEDTPGGAPSPWRQAGWRTGWA